MGFRMVVSRWLLVVGLVLLGTPALACIVGPDWEKETATEIDLNQDGKVSFDEYYSLSLKNFEIAKMNEPSKTSRIIGERIFDRNYAELGEKADEERIKANWKSMIYRQSFWEEVNLNAQKDKDGNIDREAVDKAHNELYRKCKKEKCEESLKLEDALMELLTMENYLGNVRPKCGGKK